MDTVSTTSESLEARELGVKLDNERYLDPDDFDDAYPCHIRQEMIDCLIATRSAYETSSKGVEEVLNRKYELPTSKYELLYHRVRPEAKSSSLSSHEQVFVVVRSSAGYVMVACRGTFTVSDFIADAKVAKLPMSFARGRAQTGFVQRAMSMPLDLFINLLRAGEKIIFSGHSMGGAVASLSTLRVVEALASVPMHLQIAREKVSCITFGTAPFANMELAAHVNSLYRSTYYNLVSKHDMVPRAHAVIPRFIFPVAKVCAQYLSRRWELKVFKRMVETLTRMSVEKAVMKLEETIPSLWPATWMYNFFQEAAAYDEESLFFAHVGHVLLLDPDTRGWSSTSIMDETESLGLNFCVGNKSALEIFYEHGLANYYACLLKGLELGSQHSESDVTRAQIRVKAPDEPRADLQPQQISKAPALSRVDQLNRLLLKLSGNDFPTPT